MFVNLSGVTFKQCHFHVDSAAEHFTQLQAAIPSSLAAVRTFSSQAEAQRCRLRACHAMFWSDRTSPFPGTRSLTHEGYLWTRVSGFSKPWQRRWFQIKQHKLFQADGSSLDLLTTTVKPHTDGDRRHCFEVISPARRKKFVLQAATAWDMDEWSAVARNNVAFLLDHAGDEGECESDAERPPDPRERNRTCADCGAADPSWCCINWGTCICISCSGVHREMSIAVSKVRSLTLDHIDRRVLAVFAAVGNEEANRVLEERMPDGVRVGEGAERSARDAFLRRKYERCEFVDVESVVDLAAAIRVGNAGDVFRGVCQRRAMGMRAGVRDDGMLRLAAAVGNVTVCCIVGLNTVDVDAVDERGWSPLSYAAFYGRMEAAEALLVIGCRPEAAVEAHPYEIAVARGNAKMATLFKAYWEGVVREGIVFVPLIEVEEEGERPVCEDEG
jgi:hypothetical protein